MAKRFLHALVTPAAVAIGVLGVAAPASAAPGDPAPPCVSVTVSSGGLSTMVMLRNNCTTPQRLQVVVNNILRTGCQTLAVGASQRFTFAPRSSVRVVQC